MKLQANTFESTLKQIEQATASRTEYRPILFNAADAEQRRALSDLISRGEVLDVHDTLLEQLRELASVRMAFVKMNRTELDKFANELLQGTPAHNYGTWVYYPWTRRLVHVLPQEQYRELRSSRNRYKITPDEQEKLSRAKIGVVGLSVGLSSAVTLVLESVGTVFRLADHDELSLSNMNRLRTPVYHLGINKTVIAAREMFEIDPYLDITIYNRGLDETNTDEFLTQGGKLDLIVEECDDLFIKVFIRERAKEFHIPIMMETNERGMLDVERFDLEPERPILHGLLEGVRASQLKGLSSRDKAPYVLRLLGVETVSLRMRSSILEIEQSLASWPQLASGVALGGALTTDSARRILLDTFRGSGRFFVDLESIVKDGANVPLSADRSLDEVLRRMPSQEPNISLKPRAGGASRAISHEEIREIVTCGTLAPSAGNVQPWKFIARGNTIRCELDESRAWVFLDFRKYASYAALGSAIENMDLAAKAMGYVTNLTMFPVPGSESIVCDIQINPGGEPSHSDVVLADQIAKRMSNRLRGPRKEIPRNILDDLAKAASAAGGQLWVISSPEQLDEAAAIIGGTDRIMYFSERMHHELTHEIRWTREEVEKTRDGVDVATMELSTVEFAGLKLAMSWAGMEVLRRVGGGRGIEKLSRDMIASAGAVALVAVPGLGIEAYVRGGRAMERVWLSAAHHGLAMHPMSALLYLLARLEKGGGEGLSADEAKKLAELRIRLQKLFGSDPARETEMLLFRLALTDATPAIRSLRRPVEDVLVFE